MDNKETFEYILIGLFAIVILVNQIQVSALTSAAQGSRGFSLTSALHLSGKNDLSQVDLSQIQNTMQSYAALFPIDQIKTTDDAVALLIPTGTPDYGEAMGISYDDPVAALNKMAKAYPAQFQSLTPDQRERFLNLATKPVGISCEYCCGVGPVGVTKDGQLRCGCQHNPALLTLAAWLIQNTDYSDQQVLQEVLKWKALFFPKQVVGNVMKLAGGDDSALKELPGMVGGC